MRSYLKMETFAIVDRDENNKVENVTMMDTKIYTSEDLIHWNLQDGEMVDAMFSMHVTERMKEQNNS